MKSKEKIIKSCGFSEEMERYLINYKPDDFEMLDIILGAPLSLTEKRKLIRRTVRHMTMYQSASVSLTTHRQSWN